MFLFFSKLLPLLIYPLGLTCVLIGVSIVLLMIFHFRVVKTSDPYHNYHAAHHHHHSSSHHSSSHHSSSHHSSSHHSSRHRRRSRAWNWRDPLLWIKVCLSSAILLLWLSSTPLASALTLGTLEHQFEGFTTLEKLPTADAIVVLGGATVGITPPRRYPEVNDAGDRLITAVRLYRSGKAPKMILSGGCIQWNPSSPALASEAEDMQVLLELFGIRSQDLLLDSYSLNTYQNAINTQRILRKEHLKTILLVTSAFHMPRALAIFQQLNIDTTPVPTDFRTLRDPQNSSLQDFLLNLFPSVEYLNQTSLGLKEYVGLFVYRLRGWAA